MGIYVGIALGGFSGYAAESSHDGWRKVFDWCGAFGVVYALVLLFALPDRPKTRQVAVTMPSISPMVALRELLTKGAFILLVLYFTLPALAGWVVKDWMPPILQNMFHLGQGKAGVSATLYVTIASFCGGEPHPAVGFSRVRWG
jgi:hypothetical protein